jgi:hypothetical protein
MNTQIKQLIEARAKILAEMSTLDRMERGRLSEQFLKGTKAGKSVLWGPYFVLQRRHGKAHVTERVPAERVPLVQQDIENHVRFEALADRYAQVTEELTRLRDGDPEAKKNARISKPTNSRKPRPS